MKKILITILILSTALSFITPAFAASPLALVPDDYYLHFLGGAALTGWLEKHDMSPEMAFIVTLGVAVAKEAFDSSLPGNRFDLADAAITLLGSFVMIQF